MQVCQFNNATCGTFQALTQRGYLNVNVQNIGTISADYQLTVLTSIFSQKNTSPVQVTLGLETQIGMPNAWHWRLGFWLFNAWEGGIGIGNLGPQTFLTLQAI